MLDQKLIMEINKSLRELFWKDVPGSNREIIKNLDPVCCDDSIIVTYQKKDGSVMTVYDKPLNEARITEELRLCRAGGDGPDAANQYVARTLAQEVLTKSLSAVRGYEELLTLGKDSPEREVEMEEER